jgi:hypothetical protein
VTLSFWKQSADLRRAIERLFICSALKRFHKTFQDEETNGDWSLFAFAYNQWLIKARLMISKGAASRHSQAGLESGNFPDDMTDQVCSANSTSPLTERALGGQTTA